MPTLHTLLESAESLRVDAVAQVPFCADVVGSLPAEVHLAAVERGFDLLPIREDDGRIRRVVETRALRCAVNWEHALSSAVVLDADALVAREAPVFSLLERFDGREILFTLGREGVDGVVTIYDLNQPAAHLLGFGLVLITEAKLAQALRDALGEDSDEVLRRVSMTLGCKRQSVKRWVRARDEGKEIHLSSAITFGEKLEVLGSCGLTELAETYDMARDELLQDLKEIWEFRNALAHYDEQDHRLADPRWAYEHMRRASRLARVFAA